MAKATRQLLGFVLMVILSIPIISNIPTTIPIANATNISVPPHGKDNQLEFLVNDIAENGFEW